MSPEPARRPRLSAILGNRRVAAILLLGLASGLPYNLSDATLQAWLKDTGLSNEEIGAVSLIGMAYTLKFLWAPLLDRYPLPILGRRRGWILVLQLATVVVLGSMALHGPEQGVATFTVLALALSVLSASQDVVIDAWRTDVARPEERGPAATAANLGYRGASFFAFSGALIIAQYHGWEITYLIMACAMLALVLATWWAPEPEVHVAAPLSLTEAVRGPMAALFGNPGTVALVVALVLYKLGDAFALKLFTPFLMDVGFSKAEIGIATKTVMLVANIFGSLCGGVLMVRLGLLRALLVFGSLQAVANLGYMVIALAGKNLGVMVGAVALDTFVGAMGNTALVVFIMTLCDVRYSASQYALLSALAVLPRNALGYPAGYLAGHIGWANFFLVTFFTALPGLAMMWWLRARVHSLDQARQV